jgi:hypothetical protein
MAKKKTTPKTIVPHKKDKTLFDDEFKSVDGFNLAEFSFSPLTYQSEDLAYQERYFEWDQVLGGVNKQCYFKLSYGATPPNAQTDDYLLILLYLLQKKGEGVSLKTSFYEIFKLTQSPHKPSKRNIQTIVRHLDALMDMKIETNFIYNRETKSWNKGIKTRVISSYQYKEKDHQRIIKRENSEGKVVNIMEQIHELDRIIFDPTFYEHYIKDQMPFDLKTYFSLENPTPKRLYRFANKYVSQFSSGSFSVDLTHFCITRMGMKQEYVESFKYTSKLVAKLRKPIKRVNETVEEFSIAMQKDKQSPSGYRITFSRNGEESMTLFSKEDLSTISSFTSRENKACKDLIKCGIYPNPARKLVVDLRKQLGRKAVPYINYVIKTFSRRKWNVSDKDRGGVLHKVFTEAWYRPPFEEWYSRERKTEEAEEVKRYGALQKLALAEKNDGKKTPLSEVRKKEPTLAFTKEFSLESFKKEHAGIYEEIVAVETKKTSDFIEQFGKDILGKKSKKSLVEERTLFYCKQCYDKWNKGEKDFLPQILKDS